MPNSNTKPPFPVYQILFIVISVGILYFCITTILGLLSYGCGRHAPALVRENFTEQGDSAKKYFKELRRNIKNGNKEIEVIRQEIDKVKQKYNGLSEEICYVTNQIDDGLRGNYASNVPDDEYSLPKEEQEKRAAARKEKSEKYVKDLKDRFSAGYDKIKILECFADGSSGPDEAEMTELNGIREGVMEELNDLDSNLQQAEDEFKQAKGDLSEEQMGVYYATLAYNDKYLKEMKKQSTPVKEGFADTEVLNFVPPKEPPRDINMEPHIRLPKIVDRIAKLKNDVTVVNKALVIYHNTIKKQKEVLKAFKLVANDEKEQRRQLDAQAGVIPA
jgi:predicted  nucleic acid-binding Zn-ribbon protein